MTVSAEDFLQCGATLVSGEKEIDWRTSICRTYYAAYHSSLEWHSKLPSPGSAGNGNFGSHAELVERLTHPTVSGSQKNRSKSIGYLLNWMKQRRHRADYRLAESIDQDEAGQGEADARKLIDMTT